MSLVTSRPFVSLVKSRHEVNNTLAECDACLRAEGRALPAPSVGTVSKHIELKAWKPTHCRLE
jgi:hypothetical protein